MNYSEELRARFLPEHLEDFQKSSLNEATILAAQLRAVPGTEIRDIIGFTLPGARSGIVFPYGSSGFSRVKIFPPQTDKEGHKIKYLQGKQTGNHLYIPARAEFGLSDSTAPLYMVEGEKKTLLASQDGLVAVGLAGIYNWKDSSHPGLIIDFQRISLTGRPVKLVPDSDFQTNENVLMAVFRLGGCLTQLGARVEVVVLSSGPAGDKVGYDDFRATHSVDDFLALKRISLSDPVFSAAAETCAGNGEFGPRRFMMRNTFFPNRLAEELRAARAFVASPVDDAGKGVRLLMYENGVYGRGEHHARTLAHRLLGSLSKPSYIEETVALLKEGAKLGESLLNPKATTLINVRNGMVDWRSGQLLPHSPTYLSTFQVNAKYDPAAQSPSVDQFLEEVFPADALLLCEEMIGYILVPITKFQRAFMLTGAGANGKSTFLAFLEKLLGEENVAHVSLQDCSDNRFAAAQLLNKLANIYPDLPSTTLEQTAVFKALVTGDTIKAEKKHQHPFDLRPFARLLFSANELPHAKDRSKAYFRRWAVIPFPNVFDDPGQRR